MKANNQLYRLWFYSDLHKMIRYAGGYSGLTYVKNNAQLFTKEEAFERAVDSGFCIERAHLTKEKSNDN